MDGKLNSVCRYYTVFGLKSMKVLFFVRDSEYVRIRIQHYFSLLFVHSIFLKEKGRAKMRFRQHLLNTHRGPQFWQPKFASPPIFFYKIKKIHMSTRRAYQWVGVNFSNRYPVAVGVKPVTFCKSKPGTSR